MKDQQARIAAAIAAYLEENTFLNDSDIYAPEITFGIVKEYPTPTHTECCKELADQIAAAIAPHLEEPDFPFSKLFDHMSNEHGLTLLDTELDDIIHIARGK